MKRFLSIAVLCVMATACGEASKANNPGDPIDNGLDPTTALIESPPTDGKLPANLMPPI